VFDGAVAVRRQVSRQAGQLREHGRKSWRSADARYQSTSTGQSDIVEKINIVSRANQDQVKALRPCWR